jgi:hypothetical protein
LHADHEQVVDGRLIVGGGAVVSCHGGREGVSVVVAAATDRVPQRSEHPQHCPDDEQKYTDGPKDRDFEHESENE